MIDFICFLIAVIQLTVQCFLCIFFVFFLLNVECISLWRNESANRMSLSIGTLEMVKRARLHRRQPSLRYSLIKIASNEVA